MPILRPLPSPQRPPSAPPMVRRRALIAMARLSSARLRRTENQNLCVDTVVCGTLTVHTVTVTVTVTAMMLAVKKTNLIPN